MGGRRLISIQKQIVYFLEMLHLKEMNKIFHGKKTNGHIDKIYCQTSLLMIIELAQLAWCGLMSYNELIR